MRAVYSLFMLSIVTIIMTPVVYLFGVFGGTKRRAYIGVRTWGRTLIWLFRVRIRVRGRENVDFSQPVIYMSNHLSMSDIPILMTAIPAGLAFVSKQSLANIPFLGWSMRMVGMVFISRSNHKRDVDTLQQAVDQIAPDMNFLVFPEGTRSTLAGKDLAAIKKGGFHMAMASGRAIVPVAVIGSQNIMPKDSYGIRSGDVEVRLGTPITPADAADIDGLMQAYRQGMEQLFGLEPLSQEQASRSYALEGKP